MRSEQRWILPFAASLAVLLALPPAWAVKVVGEPPPSKAASTSRPAFTVPRGTIERIDFGANAMVVDGVTYVFSGASVVVHASDPAVNGNALKLRKGNLIRFAVRKEPNSTREQITEIWVLDDKAPAPNPK